VVLSILIRSSSDDLGYSEQPRVYWLIHFVIGKKALAMSCSDDGWGTFILRIRLWCRQGSECVKVSVEAGATYISLP
jgi:hypothetical protein